jgi:hypothetical protein
MYIQRAVSINIDQGLGGRGEVRFQSNKVGFDGRHRAIHRREDQYQSERFFFNNKLFVGHVLL